MFVEQLPCLSMVCLAQGYHQSFIFCFCANGPCHCKVVFCFMHGPKPIVLDTHIEEPAMPVVQAHAPLRARGTQQQLVFQAPEGER